MPEISPTQFPAARPLFASLEKTHALVAAAFDANLPARIFVDDLAAPSLGVMVYNSRVLCAGRLTGIDSLSDWFHADLIPAHRAAGNDAYLVCFSGDDWKAACEGLFHDSTIYHGERQYYEIQDFRLEAPPALPDGFSMRFVSPELVASGLAGLDILREEMCSERVSVDDFLAHSFGVCLVYENEVAGWCLSEYNVGNRCEIGIATLEKHQRRGLATLSTQHFLTEAYRRGYTRVGWDCWARNIASCATAVKAGLTFVEQSPALVAVISEQQ